MSKPPWVPNPERAREANIARFLDYVRRECDPHVAKFIESSHK